MVFAWSNIIYTGGGWWCQVRFYCWCLPFYSVFGATLFNTKRVFGLMVACKCQDNTAQRHADARMARANPHKTTVRHLKTICLRKCNSIFVILPQIYRVSQKSKMFLERKLCIQCLYLGCLLRFHKECRRLLGHSVKQNSIATYLRLILGALYSFYYEHDYSIA